MNHLKMKLLTTLVMGMACLTTAHAQTARDIIARAEAQANGTSSFGEVTIQIVRPKWTREMSMKTWSLGTSHSMTIITDPAKDRGTGFLKRDKEVWNWVPSIDKLIKLPPSMMAQSWMGTDFSNDDLVNQSSILDDYTHELQSDSTIEGRLCWKIVLRPKPDAVVVWGKVVVWIDKKDYIQLKVKSFDEDFQLVNTLNASEVKTLGGRIMATRLEMLPANQPGYKTVFIQKTAQFDVPGIDESFFTPQNMKKQRP